MNDPKIVAELKAAAEDALSRGFAILTCEPHDKNPWAKYSPHAVNSSTRVPEIALAAWTAGEEANYGVGGGPSGLTILDVDSGINSLEELEAWRLANNIPDTFTVQSGRKGFGAHLYFTGAVKTCPYTIGNVVGELRGEGAYVVGPGSIHPSGNKYVIVKDVPLAPLPESLQNLAKEKSLYNFPKAGSKELIPVNTRWRHLQSRAGTFRNLGMSEDGIYAALKDFAATSCEDGANYPDDKIQALAVWAASEKCEESSPAIITVGSPDPDDETGIPEIPLDTITGDAVGDLALAITNGTFIPPVFARAGLKALLGAVLDGNIAFPGEETLHMRHWNAVISGRPEQGKSEVWKRIMALVGNKIVKDFSVEQPTSGFFSSGEHAIRVLAENDGKKHLVYFDEMKGLFVKAGSQGSTLFDRLLELYENTNGGAGSVSNGQAKFSNVSLSMIGNFTRNSWDNTTAGKSIAGSGFLSRMCLTYSNGVDYQGDWSMIDTSIANPAMALIIARVKWLMETSSKLKDTTQKDHTGFPFLPSEDHDANVERLKFQKWLNDEKKVIEKDNPDAAQGQRLEAHFKRDLLIRAAFAPLKEGEEPRITKDLVMRSIAWAKHELMLRLTLWPVDAGNDIAQCERKILNALRKKGPLTKAGVQKFSNADKSLGGYEAWNRAWTALLRADRIVMLSVKSNRGKEKFGFDNAVWSAAKQEWVYGI